MLDSRVRLAFLTLVIATTAAAPARGQTQRPFDVAFDGGVVDGGATDLRVSDMRTAQWTWFGGLTARSAPLPLTAGWDLSAETAIRREPTLAMARATTTVIPAYFDALIS